MDDRYPILDFSHVDSSCAISTFCYPLVGMTEQPQRDNLGDKVPLSQGCSVETVMSYL
jgi:hypothetical protein